MIYLDSGATTLQKPRAVAEAVYRAIRTAASPARGSYPASQHGAELVFQCREAAAELFHCASPEQVVLTANATHALNIAIRSLAKKGSHCVISGYEHNAVTRTLHSLPDVTVSVAEGELFQPEQLVKRFEQKLDGADFAVCCHVSNVYGYLLPVEEIAALCRRKGIPLIIDGAQSAGVLPVDVEKLGCAFFGTAGHKSLYGPQGTGLLICDGVTATKPILTGGTGSSSLDQNMPEFLPDRLEAGTHNVAGAAGLAEGIQFVRKKTEQVIGEHEKRLRQYLAEELRHFNGLKVLESHDPKLQTGVLSFVSQSHDSEEIGQRLGELGICVRSGYHCAPLAHRSGGTLENGTVRVSFSAFNRERDVEELVRAMKKIL